MSNPSHLHSTDSAQAYLAAIVDSVDDGFITTTPYGAITGWNMAARQLSGYAADVTIKIGDVTHDFAEYVHEANK